MAAKRTILERARVSALYARALVHEFRWTLATALAAVLVGGFLFSIPPHKNLGGARPDTAFQP